MKDSFKVVKRILRYVKGTISYGLSFSHASLSTIFGFSDVDWAHYIGGHLVSWSDKKQTIVPCSSCES